MTKELSLTPRPDTFESLQSDLEKRRRILDSQLRTIIATIRSDVGANGYLALHVINQLLKTGYDVRGTIRSRKADDKLRATFPEYYGGRLTTTFVEDLANPELFREAFDENTVGAIHVASPTHARTEDAVRDMLNPAVKGAIGILEAAKIYAGPSFHRVVHLSSTAAIMDSKKGPRPGYTYTNSDWNPVTFEEAAAIEDHVSLYVASKALSEKAVWAWMTEHKPKFDLACVNPTMVFGPHLETISNMDEFTSTAKFLWRLVDAAEIPQLMWAGCVDVRDTAAMTVAAFEKHEAGGQRLFLTALAEVLGRDMNLDDPERDSTLGILTSHKNSRNGVPHSLSNYNGFFPGMPGWNKNESECGFMQLHLRNIDGTVKLQSANLRQMPEIHLGFFS
ncbi:ketoreductase [Colletotrichum tabaci]|uniref:Ketoreductase n=1 Tax=Colletotrichum tabaci TaxID=1209068 RepID=A0AAV9SZ49_9PEZI